jgi:aconitate hydratase
MILTRKLISECLISGVTKVGLGIALNSDQGLLSDVLGEPVVLEFAAMGMDRICILLAVEYIDHNLVENDHLNADEHLFLRSACQRFGV